MSLYRRKNSPYWWTQIQIANHRVHRSTGCTARRDALAFEKEFRRQLLAEQGRVQAQPSLTLDEALGRYWTEHGHKLGWRKAVATYSRQLLDYFGQDQPLGDIDSRAVARAVQCWTDNQDGPANISRRLAVLRGVLRRADQQWGVSVHSIAWRSLKPAEPKGRTRWLTPDEARALCEACPTHIRLAVEWSLYTGCRLGETRDLRWSDVFEARGYCEVAGKTGSRRVILSTAALHVLARCVRQGGRVFDLTNQRRHFAQACRTCGFTDFRWHDLRHTFATFLRQSGAPLDVIQRALGHAALATTTRYAHVEDREVVRAIEGLPTLSAPPENIIRLRDRKT